MPSGRRRPQPDQLVFFVDRGLGRRWVPGVLRDHGLTVVHMADLYPDGEDQSVDDDRWIADVSAQGWVALTKDTAIVRHHVAALRRSSLRMFALSNANLTGEQMAACFERNLHRIVRRSRRPGPFVDVVHRERIERRWP